MRPRNELKDILEAICQNVYFQPPETIKMKYPCIVYSLERIEATHANNKPYALNNRYGLTYITRNPDDANRHEIAMLPMCSFERAYTADNLHHYTYRLYF